MKRLKCRKQFHRFLRMTTLCCILAVCAPIIAGLTPNLRFERYGIEDGLSSSVVNAIIQDKTGFIWLGTMDGVCRFDGTRFRTYRFSPRIANSLSNNYVRCFLVDNQGRLFIGTSSGLNLYRPESDDFVLLMGSGEKTDMFRDEEFRTLYQDPAGQIWVGTQRNGLLRWDETKGFTPCGPPEEERKALGSAVVDDILADRVGQLWIGTQGGLGCYNPATGAWRYYHHNAVNKNDPNALPYEEVHALVLSPNGELWLGCSNGSIVKMQANGTFRTYWLTDSHLIKSIAKMYFTGDGKLWVPTFGSGLILFDPQNETMQTIRNNPSDSHSLSTDAIRSMYQDRNGNCWLGTYEGGVNKFNPSTMAIALFRNDPKDSNSLSNNSIRAFCEGLNGKLWVGTDGGGMNEVDRKTGEVKRYQHDPKNPNSLAHNSVFAILNDGDKGLWAGTYGAGLDYLDFKTGVFRHYRHDPNKPNSLPMDFPTVLTYDDHGNLWVGTYGGGIGEMNKENGTFTNYSRQQGQLMGLPENRIWAMTMGKNRKLWIATYGGGLAALDLDTRFFVVYKSDSTYENSLSNDTVFAFQSDQADGFWVGTTFGLNHMTFDSIGEPIFKIYTDQNGLLGNSFPGIAIDHRGHVWASSYAGLNQLDPATETILTYDAYDGLQGNEFKQNAALKLSDGSLAFGGVNGFNIFQPNAFERPSVPPDAALTQILRFNQPYKPPQKENGSYLFTHKDGMITFEIAVLDYTAPSRNRFQYRLDGFDRDWIEGSKAITYTNLNPGNYKLRIRTTNSSNQWHEDALVLSLNVQPPPWATWWAYSLYLSFICSVLALAYWLKTRGQRRELERQRTLVESLQRLDKLKDEILANTSHELRTPLNGMIGIAESLVDGATGKLGEQTLANLRMIVNSGYRLTALVNDILDFSKMRNRQLSLSCMPQNLHSLVNQVLELMRPHALSKNVQLFNDVPKDLPSVNADQNRLLQVLHNLIGNSEKFTDQGEVRVSASIKDGMVEVVVHDTGCGIAEADLTRIFDTFEQADGSTARVHGGTGLGLAISRKIIELHGGKIWVISTPGQGSNFHFTLPVSEISAPEPSKQRQLNRATPDQPLEQPSSQIANTSDPHNAFNILIVDDEPVNLQVLVNQLTVAHYKVTLAKSGFEALQALESGTRFHVILLDIMMPRMSGYEVCQRIREKYSPQDLPILLLTAKNQVADLVMGFESGANDYLIKPVSKNELLARINTHIRLFQAAQQLEGFNQDLSNQVELRTRELSDRNQELEKLNEIVKAVNEGHHKQDVIQTLVNKSLSLFPQADSAVFLSMADENRKFLVSEACGVLKARWEGAELPYRNALSFFENHRIRLESGVFLLRPEPAEPDLLVPGLLLPPAMLGMVVSIGEQPEGVLILAHSENADAFSHSDLEKCRRFREHAIGAFLKAKMFDELEDTTKHLRLTQERLVEAAHLAGMAEIATEVLHNVGNSLNSVNVSAQSIHQALENNRPLILFEKVVGLISENLSQLDHFLVNDPRGKKIPSVLKDLYDGLNQVNSDLDHEVLHLRDNIENIRLIVENQIKYTEVTGLFEPLDPNILLSDTLKTKAGRFSELKIEVRREGNFPDPVVLKRNKFQQILEILLHNAEEALSLLAEGQPRQIEILVKSGPGLHPCLEIANSGPPIPEEMQAVIFSQGFSDKPGHQGGQLHFAANAMNEMEGKLTVENDGPQGGPRFRIILPARGSF